jgi:hypothetical protein
MAIVFHPCQCCRDAGCKPAVLQLLKQVLAGAFPPSARWLANLPEAVLADVKTAAVLCADSIDDLLRWLLPDTLERQRPERQKSLHYFLTFNGNEKVAALHVPALTFVVDTHFKLSLCL